MFCRGEASDNVSLRGVRGSTQLMWGGWGGMLTFLGLAHMVDGRAARAVQL